MNLPTLKKILMAYYIPLIYINLNRFKKSKL